LDYRQRRGAPPLRCCCHAWPSKRRTKNWETVARIVSPWAHLPRATRSLITQQTPTPVSESRWVEVGSVANPLSVSFFEHGTTGSNDSPLGDGARVRRNEQNHIRYRGKVLFRDLRDHDHSRGTSPFKPFTCLSCCSSRRTTASAAAGLPTFQLFLG
jgi:hypothetical protein